MSADPVRPSGVRATLTPKRPKREHETSDLLGMIRRGMRAYVKRAGTEGDLEGLGEFAKLLDEADGLVADLVATLRAEPWAYSWADIGRVLGIRRQSAQERFRDVGGARRPGGQPGYLR
jgi:hypothetical protein